MAEKDGITDVILHPSWLNYVKNFFWAFVLMVLAVRTFSVIGPILILFAVIIILYAAWRRVSRTYTMTSKVVRSKIGIISRNENEIKIGDIREIGIRQGILQRIFKVGTVFFATAATAGVEVVFEGVKDPAGIKEQVNKIQQAI